MKRFSYNSRYKFATVFIVFVNVSLCLFAQEVQIVPSLPSGCAQCNVSPPTPPISSFETNTVSCTGAWGATNPSHTNSDHSFTIANKACYNAGNDMWNAIVNSIISTVGIIRKCPSHPANLVCSGDIAGKTKAEAIALLAIYPSGSITLSDVQSAGQSSWACEECTARHEEAHMDIDWKQDALTPEITAFISYLQTNGITIQCSDPTSLNCTNAISTAAKNSYDLKWISVVVQALTAWDAQPEGTNGYNAEIPCYQAIRDALVIKSNQP